MIQYINYGSLINQLFAHLPKMDFKPSWMKNGAYGGATTETLPYPHGAEDPITGQKIILIPNVNGETAVIFQITRKSGLAGYHLNLKFFPNKKDNSATPVALGNKASVSDPGAYIAYGLLQALAIELDAEEQLNDLVLEAHEREHDQSENDRHLNFLKARQREIDHLDLKGKDPVDVLRTLDPRLPDER